MIVYEHGIINLRSIQEIQFFNWIFAPFAWKKIDQRQTGGNYVQEVSLDDRRKIPPEIPQKRKKARPENHEKKFLINIRIAYIVLLKPKGRNKYGKR